MSEARGIKPTALIIDDEQQIRRLLLREVWGPNSLDHTDYLRVHIAHLRQKLEPDASRSTYLKTEAGIGYRLVEKE
jgi:two-component system KDP operon response regulator KdpE